MRIVSVILSFLVFAFSLVSSSANSVDFARDVQPILAKHCYECHGAELQKGKLRLDEREAALKHSGLIVAGKAGESEMVRRISLPKGHDDIMPNRGEPLTASEIAKIKDWVDQGAVWPNNAVVSKHWSYVNPVRPALPKVKDSKWPKNDIDYFILSRLEKERMRPSARADKAALLRRVYLDLVGLPPSPEVLEQFLKDPSPNAYQKIVERLLASPQYGERWARPWLDLARYADSNGYQKDDFWDIWPYRDWVIGAMNSDMPFDQFTIEQIAGDLLPEATERQKIATGFNRCVPTNVEAGSDQEETRVNQVFDRVNTIGSVWLGTTLECAQCHNHKYDPISQKEYYQLFAVFNNTAKETDFLTPKAKASLRFKGPYMEISDPQSAEKKRKLQSQIDALAKKIEERSSLLLKEQDEWEASLQKSMPDTGPQPVDVVAFEAESGSAYKLLEDKSVLLITGDNEAVPEEDTYTVKFRPAIKGVTTFKLEVLADPSLPGGGPGRGDSRTPNFVLNTFTANVSSGDGKAKPLRFTNAVASFSQQRFPVADAIDRNPKSGWAIRPEFAKDHWALFHLDRPTDFGNDSELVFKLEQNNGAGRLIGRFRISALTGAAKEDAVPAEIVEIVRIPRDQRTGAQKKKVEAFYLSKDKSAAKWNAELAKLETELKNFRAPRTLVMEEVSEARMSTMFVRGNFLQPGEPVKGGTPAVLHPLEDANPNRLSLARWLVNTNNPLVARVTVNRWWAEFFGEGLVRTPEDFGIKGDHPTHPELLDWLAMEFMHPSKGTPWSMKNIHRLIVTSATYQQSSAFTPELLEKDDQNKLYARGPRFRMDAEMIRDNALAVSGLLSLKMGGPPIRPYQPPGLWESKVGGVAISYDMSEGEDRYRRGVYVVWKRTAPYPAFINFDATARNACTIKRSRSNTPQQALTLLNDPVYVEAAASLAKRVLKEQTSGEVKDKINRAFTLCVGRVPSVKESSILEKLYEEQLVEAGKNPKAAEKLLSQFGTPEGVTIAEFSAWHAVAWALLNLNETITKG